MPVPLNDCGTSKILSERYVFLLIYKYFVSCVVGCPGLVVAFILFLLFINVYFEWLAQINSVHWWSAVVVSTGGHYIGYDTKWLTLKIKVSICDLALAGN